MAQGKFQSDRTRVPRPVAAEIAKRREHDANGTHRWKEQDVDGIPCRQCQVKACAHIQFWNEKRGEWI